MGQARGRGRDARRDGLTGVCGTVRSVGTLHYMTCLHGVQGPIPHECDRSVGPDAAADEPNRLGRGDRAPSPCGGRPEPGVLSPPIYPM